jgi:hypothetical protein
MAHFILKNREEGKLYVHFKGSYHSDNFEGIYWYLKQSSPHLKILRISSIEQEIIRKFSKENKQ